MRKNYLNQNVFIFGLVTLTIGILFVQNISFARDYEDELEVENEGSQYEIREKEYGGTKFKYLYDTQQDNLTQTQSVPEAPLNSALTEAQVAQVEKNYVKIVEALYQVSDTDSNGIDDDLESAFRSLMKNR